MAFWQVACSVSVRHARASTGGLGHAHDLNQLVRTLWTQLGHVNVDQFGHHVEEDTFDALLLDINSVKQGDDAVHGAEYQIDTVLVIRESTGPVRR